MNRGKKEEIIRRVKDRIRVLIDIGKNISSVDRELSRLYLWRAFYLAKRHRIKIGEVTEKNSFCRKCYELWDKKGKKEESRGGKLIYICKRCGYKKIISRSRE